MRTIIHFICCLLLVSTVTGQNLVNLRIDPDNARGGTASQIFDSVSFIPLETTKQSLFGKIDQLEVTDQYFIILDQQSHSILIFDKKGKYHAKIQPNAPGKLLDYFTLDRDNHQILTTSDADGVLGLYNFDGQFLKEEPCPVQIRTLFRFNNNVFLYNLRRPVHSTSVDQTAYDLMFARGTNTLARQLNPYNKKYTSAEYNITSNPINDAGEGNTCMFSLPFCYDVYHMNDTGILKTYRFLFPLQYSLPNNFAYDSSFANKRALVAYRTQENANKIVGIERSYKFGSYFVFSTSMTKPSFEGKNYFYNLNNGLLYSFARVVADSSSFYFPILSNILEPVHAVSNNCIYTSMPSFLLLQYKDKNEQPIKYNAVLSQFFATGTKKDNPILVQVKLKPSL